MMEVLITYLMNLKYEYILQNKYNANINITIEMYLKNIKFWNIYYNRNKYQGDNHTNIYSDFKNMPLGKY